MIQRIKHINHSEKKVTINLGVDKEFIRLKFSSYKKITFPSSDKNAHKSEVEEEKKRDGEKRIE